MQPPLKPSFFFAVFTMLFLAVFYFTVTNMAGIYIASDLGGSHITSVYPMVFYGLGNAIAIPLSKHLTHLYGPFRLAIASLFLYTFFSLLCALASTYPAFNLCRLGLGLSAGPFFYLFRYWIDEYAPPEKEKLFSSIAILIFAVVPVTGACFGAVLAYETFWRWIFHLNTPISLILIFYFWSVRKPFDRKKLPFDTIGYVYYCIAISSLVTAATLTQELDWYRSDIIVALTLIGIPSLILFIGWELKHPYPAVNLKLLKNPTLAYALLNLAVLFSTYFGMIILVALWLQIFANYTPLWIAAILGSMGLAGIFGFLLARFWIERLNRRLLLAIAIFCIMASCLYTIHFPDNIDFARLAITRSMAGFGLVLFLIPLFNISFSCCKKENDLDVFILVQCVRTLASSLGAGIYVTVWWRRQVFYHSRLSELLTPESHLTKEYFERATKIFGLTKPQAHEMLNVLLDTQANSLGLNDTFGFMALLMGIFLLLALSSYLVNKFKISGIGS